MRDRLTNEISEKLREQTRQMLKNVNDWPLWPMLPLKHITKRDPEMPSMPLMGIVLERGSSGRADLSIYLTNAFAPDIETCDKLHFQSLDDMVADGWRVD